MSALMARGMTRDSAARELARQRPDLREKFVNEHNTEHGRKARKGA